MFRKTCAGLLVLFFMATLSVTNAAEQTKQDELVHSSMQTLKNFLADPDMGWVRKHLREARAVLIIPRKLSGAFIFGADGGSGVMLARDSRLGWSYPAFYTMGSFSFGLQAGGKTSEVILLVMTDKGVDSLLSTDVKLGADLSVAAGPVGAGAEAKTADVLAFARSKGAYGGISVSGAVIKPRPDWNRIYYGKPVRSIDILVKRSVSKASADALVHSLDTVSGHK